MKQIYKRNLPLLGITEFFSFFGITAFWLLFLSQQGMSLWQIGILESLFHLTSLLSEVPSGVLADRFTYRRNLFLGRFVTIISALFMIFGNGNFFLYALGMIFSAWGYNFDSGTSQALLYETAKELKQESRYLTFISYLNGVSEATRTLGMVVAGFLVHGWLIYTYHIQIVCSLLGILCIWGIKEPSIKMKKEESPTVLQIIQTVYQLFRKQSRLFYQMLMVQVMLTLITMYYFYYQSQLPHLQSWQISLMMLLSSGCNILAIYLANKIGQKIKTQLVLWSILGCSGVLFLFTILNNHFVYAVIFLVSDALVVLFYPLYETELQAAFDSKVRATMLSVYAMLGSFAMIILFPFMGALIERFGFMSSFFGLGVLLIAMSILFVLIQKNNKREDFE